MPRFREQQLALAYLRRKGTEASTASILERMEQTFGELDRILDAIPEETARRRPAADRWSVQEIVDHLVVSNRPALEQLRILLAGRDAEGGPVPAGLQSEDPLARPWPEVRDELSRLHQSFIDEIRQAAPTLGDSPGTATAPIEMVVRCATPQGDEAVHWEERFDWKAFSLAGRVHALEHLAQVQRTLEALGAA